MKIKKEHPPNSGCVVNISLWGQASAFGRKYKSSPWKMITIDQFYSCGKEGRGSLPPLRTLHITWEVPLQSPQSHSTTYLSLKSRSAQVGEVSKDEVDFFFPNSAEVWSSAVTLSLFVTFCFCLCVLRRAALVCIIILSVFRPPLCQTSSARWHCRHVWLGRVQVFFSRSTFAWFLVHGGRSIFKSPLNWVISGQR